MADLARECVVGGLQVQATKPYYKPYLEASEPMYVRPRVQELWERMPGDEWTWASKHYFDGTN